MIVHMVRNSKFFKEGEIRNKIKKRKPMLEYFTPIIKNIVCGTFREELTWEGVKRWLVDAPKQS